MMKKRNDYLLISPENQIDNFIKDNENTQTILDTIRMPLAEYFPNSKFSLEIYDELDWTTEAKLLVNVDVTEEMFFNGMLSHFIDIYEKINP